MVLRNRVVMGLYGSVELSETGFFQACLKMLSHIIMRPFSVKVNRKM